MKSKLRKFALLACCLSLLPLNASWAEDTTWKEDAEAGVRQLKADQLEKGCALLESARAKAKAANVPPLEITPIINYLGTAKLALRKSAEAEALITENLAVARKMPRLFMHAEPLFKEALGISKKLVDQPVMAISEMENLGSLYMRENRNKEAEPLLKDSLAMSLKTLGANHGQTASCKGTLAELYGSEGKKAEAEALFKESIATFKKGCTGQPQRS